MGFLDKAKAAADQLAAKADTAMANAGLGVPATDNPEKYLRDLGVLAFLEATGRPVPEEERERVLAALRDMDARGLVRNLALQTAAPPPGAVPPPPGGAVPPPPGAAAPPPPGGAATPPPGAAAPPPPAAAAPPPPMTGAPASPPPPSSAPPPPPSWA